MLKVLTAESYYLRFTASEGSSSLNCKIDERFFRKLGTYLSVWPEKNAKCLLKLPQIDFTRKMIDFETFTKIA